MRPRPVAESATSAVPAVAVTDYAPMRWPFFFSDFRKKSPIHHEPTKRKAIIPLGVFHGNLGAHLHLARHLPIFYFWKVMLVKYIAWRTTSAPDRICRHASSPYQHGISHPSCLYYHLDGELPSQGKKPDSHHHSAGSL